MSDQGFPLEKIFGSRTRVKIITLFTTGVKRPYFVREIARSVDERLNAVRRELDILEKIGMLVSEQQNRRKYYELNTEFILNDELASIMHKMGPGVQDTLFKDLEHVGTVHYACASGCFTGAHDAPTDLLLVGELNEKRLEQFISRVEMQLGREVTYTPMTDNEFTYRIAFNDSFLRALFARSHKELVNTLPAAQSPSQLITEKQKSPNATTITE